MDFIPQRALRATWCRVTIERLEVRPSRDGPVTLAGGQGRGAKNVARRLSLHQRAATWRPATIERRQVRPSRGSGPSPACREKRVRARRASRRRLRRRKRRGPWLALPVRTPRGGRRRWSGCFLVLCDAGSGGAAHSLVPAQNIGFMYASAQLGKPMALSTIDKSLAFPQNKAHLKPGGLNSVVACKEARLQRRTCRSCKSYFSR